MRRRSLITGAAALAAYRSIDAKAAMVGSRRILLGSASAQQFGVIYSKTSWANLNDFNINGATPTITGANAIRMAPASLGTFGQNIELKTPVTTDEDVDFTVIATYVSASSPAYGLGLGKSSKNTWAGQTHSLAAQYATNVNPNQMNIYYNEAGANVAANVAFGNTNSDFRVGDQLMLTYSQRGALCTDTAVNLTRGTAPNVLTATAGLLPASAWAPPNMAAFRIYAFGITFDITSITLTSRQYASPRVLCIGDSKTARSMAGTSPGWVDLIVPTFRFVDVFGGPSDRTIEVLLGMTYALQFKPKNLILNIGRNDLAASVPTATWQANYQSIVSQFQAIGTNIIHLLPIPETNTDQSSLKSFIQSTYPTGKMIDVSPTWSNGTDLASDNIHPTAAGHVLIANYVNASGLIV